MHASVYVCVYVCMHASMFVCTSSMFVCTYTYIVCGYLYAYMYIYIYVYKYTCSRIQYLGTCNLAIFYICELAVETKLLLLCLSSLIAGSRKQTYIIKCRAFKRTRNTRRYGTNSAKSLHLCLHATRGIFIYTVKY
jgi:hypothetical protein